MYISNLGPHTSHLAPLTSHLAPHTSHLTPLTSHLPPDTSQVTPHTYGPPTVCLRPPTVHLGSTYAPPGLLPGRLSWAFPGPTHTEQNKMAACTKDSISQWRFLMPKPLYVIRVTIGSLQFHLAQVKPLNELRLRLLLREPSTLPFLLPPCLPNQPLPLDPFRISLVHFQQSPLSYVCSIVMSTQAWTPPAVHPFHQL